MLSLLKIESIGEGAFQNTNLNSEYIYLNGAIEHIGSNAFTNIDVAIANYDGLEWNAPDASPAWLAPLIYEPVTEETASGSGDPYIVSLFQ